MAIFNGLEELGKSFLLLRLGVLKSHDLEIPELYELAAASFHKHNVKFQVFLDMFAISMNLELVRLTAQLQGEPKDEFETTRDRERQLELLPEKISQENDIYLDLIEKSKSVEKTADKDYSSGWMIARSRSSYVDFEEIEGSLIASSPNEITERETVTYLMMLVTMVESFTFLFETVEAYLEEEEGYEKRFFEIWSKAVSKRAELNYNANKNI